MASKTSKTSTVNTTTGVVDGIEDAIAALSAAEAEAKAVNGEASIVRAKKSSAAVGVVYAANDAKADETSLRSALLATGVLKGTASKIITVLRAHREGKIDLATIDREAASLSGLYALATRGETVEKVEAAPEGPQIIEKVIEVVKEKEYATVEDMADDLIARFILSADDPFSVSGKVLVMLTERIDKAVAPFSHSE